MPQKELSALVASQENDGFQSLKVVMKTQKIEVHSARSREEAPRMLDSNHPQRIFKSKLLYGGTLRHVFNMSENIAVSTGVICSWRKRRHSPLPIACGASIDEAADSREVLAQCFVRRSNQSADR